MQIDFTVPGRAVPKGRARVVGVGRKAHAYTPARTVAWEAKVRDACKAAMATAGQLRATHDTPLAVEIIAYYSRPKGKMQHAARAVWPIVKGDIDNVAKAILDGMNGTAYVDDSQIVSLCAHRRYVSGWHPPHVRVRLWECGCGPGDWVAARSDG